MCSIEDDRCVVPLSAFLRLILLLNLRHGRVLKRTVCQALGEMVTNRVFLFLT